MNESYVTYKTFTTEANKNESILQVFNKRKGMQTDLYMGDTVAAPKTNGEICVWMKSYDIDDRQKLYIYNLKNGVFEGIELENIFSYALLGKYLLVNQNGKIVCYDTLDKKFAEIFTQGDSLGYTSNGLNENVYFTRWIDLGRYEYINLK